jgi:hypothetical protein
VYGNTGHVRVVEAEIVLADKADLLQKPTGIIRIDERLRKIVADHTWSAKCVADRSREVASNRLGARLIRDANIHVFKANARMNAAFHLRNHGRNDRSMQRCDLILHVIMHSPTSAFASAAR